ncbi:MAG: NACHT domain-containing protein [Anaerolineae bacterium]|nr:NACHT domain-containing protein [Anaerolineae bacterium]
MSIPSDLYRRLHTTLLTCSPSDSDNHLRTLFVDARLAPWRAKIPQAETPDMRIRNLIDALHNQYNHHQENALILFLAVLRDQQALTNSCYRSLEDLRQELEYLIRTQIPYTPEWEVTLASYFDKLRRLYCNIQIFGQPRPILLNDIFTDVYVLEQPLAFRRFDVRQLHTDPDHVKDAERISGLDILTREEGNHLFLLGKPGAGKTTFLKYVTLYAIDQQYSKIPVFVGLKQWADSGLTLLDYIQQLFMPSGVLDTRDFVTKLLETGQGLILCDGLDEVNVTQEQRGRIIAELKSFIQRYYDCQYLITCRNAATDYTFTGFTYVEIADFDAIQIAAFADKWFYGMPAKRDTFLEELAKPEHRGLRELSRVPLLLTMLCLAFDVNLDFPQRRVEIYTDALDALLRKWDSSRNIKRDLIYRGLSTGRKHQLFARIAVQTFERGDHFIPQQQLEDQIVAYLQRLPDTDKLSDDIDGHAILKAIEAQHGILIERAHAIYAFAHLTFQEYYTARYIVENARRGTLPQLLTHATDSRWREVILLTASILDDADDFFSFFLEVLNEQIQNSVSLNEFLAWADHKARALSNGVPSAIQRSAYCLMAVNFIRDYPNIRTQVLNLVLALDRDETFFPSTSRLPSRTRKSSLFSQNIFPMYFAIDGVFATLLHRAQTLVLARDHNLDDGGIQDLTMVMAEALVRCQQAGLHALHQQLTALTLPTVESSRRYCQEFTDRLYMLLCTHRDLGRDWNLSPTQAQQVADYFYSAELLIQCLDLAYVTDRMNIEMELLLPREPCNTIPNDDNFIV